MHSEMQARAILLENRSPVSASTVL